jgi:hypothetical protein
MRLLGAGNDTASRVAFPAAGVVPPGAIGVALEAASAGDAGDRGEAAVSDREGREITLNRNRLGKFHAASLGRRPANVGGAPVVLGLRPGCDRAAALTDRAVRPSMRLQLQTATTGTSTGTHGQQSEPEWWKPAWHDVREWTREPRSEVPRRDARRRRAGPRYIGPERARTDVVRTKGGTAEESLRP